MSENKIRYKKSPIRESNLKFESMVGSIFNKIDVRKGNTRINKKIDKSKVSSASNQVKN